MKKLLLALILLLPIPTLASNSDNGAWGALMLTAPITEKISGYLELQTRSNHGGEDISANIIRPALFYNVDKNNSVAFGYGAQFNRDDKSGDYNVEHRVWQQHQYFDNLSDSLNLQVRTRLEERLMPFSNNISWRLRERLRSEYHVTTNTYFVAFDELFINVNSIDGTQAQQGIDQNRAFVGLGYNFNKHAKIEGGYQNQWVNNKQNVDDNLNNIFLVNAYYDF